MQGNPYRMGISEVSHFFFEKCDTYFSRLYNVYNRYVIYIEFIV